MSEVEHFLFVAGGMRLASAVNSIASVHTDLNTNPVGATVDWFLGIAVCDGELLPVSDLGLLLNNQASTGEIIQVAKSIGIAALRVDSVIGIKQCKVTQQVVVFEGREYTLFDISELMQSERFSNIEEAIV